MFETMRELFSDVKKYGNKWSLASFCAALFTATRCLIGAEYGLAWAYFLASVLAFNVLLTEVLLGLEKETSSRLKRERDQYDHDRWVLYGIVNKRGSKIDELTEVLKAKTQDTL